MKVTKRFMILLILILVIVPLFNIGGCKKTWAGVHTVLKNGYEKKYADWNWEQRYAAAELLNISAYYGDVEFSWLDLPVEKIKVDDAVSTTPCGDH